MITQVFNSHEEFLKRPYKSVNGVSRDFVDKHPDYIKCNLTNFGCWNCAGCIRCTECTSCRYCSECIICIECYGCVRCVWLKWGSGSEYEALNY